MLEGILPVAPSKCFKNGLLEVEDLPIRNEKTKPE
jgi:hypothetical protein